MYIEAFYNSPPGPSGLAAKNRYSRNEIISAVQSIVAKVLGINETKAEHHARFSYDLGADSLDITDIVVEVEKYFHISISDKRVEKMATVGDLTGYVEVLTTGRI